MARRHVLLVNLGTPAAPTAAAVRTFLAEFLSDPLVVDAPAWLWWPVLHGIVLRTRPARVARMYASIWTDEGSPLEAGTARMARALDRKLGDDVEVCHAHRYGEPALEEVLSRLARQDATSVTLVPLFPQPTAATSGTITAIAAGRLPVAAIPPDCPHYVEALAARCRPALEAGADHLLVSFHGIPERVDEPLGFPYRTACEATHQALLARLELDPERATLAFQSRFGPGRWLEPATDRSLAALPERGVRHVAVTCPGFLTEGLETLEEIGVRGRATFLKAGGKQLTLVPAVEDHPAMVVSLRAAVVRTGLLPE